MDDCVSIEFVPAAIGDVGAGGVRFLLHAPAEKIPGGKLRALRAHDSYEHVPVRVVHDVSCSIFAEGVADVAGGVPIFPGYEPPCADERIRCHRPSLALYASALARIMMPPADAGHELRRTPQRRAKAKFTRWRICIELERGLLLCSKTHPFRNLSEQEAEQGLQFTSTILHNPGPLLPERAGAMPLLAPVQYRWAIPTMLWCSAYKLPRTLLLRGRVNKEKKQLS